ncbi:hypothetical protein ACROYT_G005221 [Oculina patagonica]
MCLSSWLILYTDKGYFTSTILHSQHIGVVNDRLSHLTVILCKLPTKLCFGADPTMPTSFKVEFNNDDDDEEDDDDENGVFSG